MDSDTDFSMDPVLDHVKDNSDDDAPEAVDLISAKQTYLQQTQAQKQHLQSIKEKQKLKNKEKDAFLKQRKLERTQTDSPPETKDLEKVKEDNEERLVMKKNKNQEEEKLPTEILIAFDEKER